jgi:hypothetical protein
LKFIRYDKEWSHLVDEVPLITMGHFDLVAAEQGRKEMFFQRQQKRRDRRAKGGA